MSTWEFDNGMKKGINYFNRGMYYEARDEFQWFCDYNWGSMNSGQQQYALDYLGAAKQRAEQASNVSYSYDYDDEYCYHGYIGNEVDFENGCLHNGSRLQRMGITQIRAFRKRNKIG